MISIEAGYKGYMAVEYLINALSLFKASPQVIEEVLAKVVTPDTLVIALNHAAKAIEQNGITFK